MELNREQLIESLMRNDSCYAEDIKVINEAIALIRYDEEKIKELTEENERLQKANDVLLLMPSIKDVQADTVRKMQERVRTMFLSKNTYYAEQVFSYIDQIAKEMLEGGNG